MKWYKANQPAPKGSYFNPYMWEIIQHNGNAGEVLPGSANIKYMKFPIIFSLITGPIGGLTLVLFVPFAGIVGLIYLFIKWVSGLFQKQKNA